MKQVLEGQLTVIESMIKQPTSVRPGDSFRMLEHPFPSSTRTPPQKPLFSDSNSSYSSGDGYQK